MKKSAFLLLILMLSLGCENSDKLTFEPSQLKGSDCSDCPKIEINLIQALDETALANAINTALEEEVIAILSFDEEETIDNLNKAVSSFHRSYQELKEKFPDETVGWEAKIDAEVVYEDNDMLTIILNAYTFTGGAHGYSSTRLLNFDKINGKEIENWELFDDEEGFRNFAETKFRIQEDIPQDDNINATGFMFEGDTFQLAENLGYAEEGIQMIYNQYEIASYADGPKTMVLPFAEVNKYLKRPNKP
ncbi:MAG: DUF4163 domain-containing protein [Bacteroidota bacterium]